MFDGDNLPHELLLTTRQNTKLRNAFNNNMSTDMKLSRTQISKIIQSAGFLGSLMKGAVPLAKNMLGPLGITVAVSAINAEFQKNSCFWDSYFNSLKYRNE